MTLKANVGDKVTVEKTVGEVDVTLFAGLSGDHYAAHTNHEFMKNSAYGQRIAHGALLVGYMSAASTRMIEYAQRNGQEGTPVALGYDRMRFLAPVLFGDTVTVEYTLAAVDHEKRRTTAQINIHNQRGELVAVAEGLLKWL